MTLLHRESINKKRLFLEELREVEITEKDKEIFLDREEVILDYERKEDRDKSEVTEVRKVKREERPKGQAEVELFEGRD